MGEIASNMPLEAADSPELTTEETLRRQIDLLIEDGDRLAAQLKTHGDHQSTIALGHQASQCETCSRVSSHEDVVGQVHAQLAQITAAAETVAATALGDYERAMTGGHVASLIEDEADEAQIGRVSWVVMAGLKRQL